MHGFHKTVTRKRNIILILKIQRLVIQIYSGHPEFLSMYFMEEEAITHHNSFSVTGWMLCVITHIGKDPKYHSDSDNRKQVKNVIMIFFRVLSLDKTDVSQDTFWTEYTDFYNKNGSFYGEVFIFKSKDIRDGNSNFCDKKYSLPCTNVIGFVACRFTSKVLGIGAA